jgi:hypothetical protein
MRFNMLFEWFSHVLHSKRELSTRFFVLLLNPLQ